MQAMKLQKSSVGASVVLLMDVRDAAGDQLTTGTPGYTGHKDFGDLDTLTLSGATPTWHNPAAGRPGAGTGDPRWNPGIDGLDGFNLEVLIPGTVFDEPGRYQITVTVVAGGFTAKMPWIIDVGSS